MSVSESVAFVCKDEARLLKLCALAESHDQRAIKQLTWIRDTLMKSDFQDLQEFAGTARDIVKDPRRALKQAQEALDRRTAWRGL
jgi:hypothetical protein